MRRVLVAGMAAVTMLAGASVARADHTHVLPLNRRHPLHVFVHLGVPGADGEIAVMGSAQDPCAATGDYVNG